MLTRSKAYQAPSLFSGLAEMLDQTHPLFRLAGKIDWQMFDDAFEPLFCQDRGRPAKPIRLMVGLLILKHIRNVSYGQENEASIIGLVDNWAVCLYL